MISLSGKLVFAIRNGWCPTHEGVFLNVFKPGVQYNCEVIIQVRQLTDEV